MKSLVKFSVDRAITVFMVVIAVAVFGLVSFTRLTTDLFPSVNIPFAVVVTSYPGASPDEVEQRLSVPLENVFQTTTNILEVTSISQENVSMIMLEFNASANMDSAVIEMRESLNAVANQLPEDAGNPVIIRLNPDMLPIMMMSVTYDGKDLRELTEWVNDDLRPQIERVPGVASLSISGGYDSEIRIFLDQESIDGFNDALPPELDFTLDKDYIKTILNGQNFSFPAGFVRVQGSDYLVRVGDSIEDLDEIKQLTLFDIGVPGTKLILDDVADVAFVAANDRVYSKVNGEDALTITIQKGSEYATTDVTNAINAVLTEFEDTHEAFNVAMLLDQGEYINESTSSVTNNLLLGGVLAILILFIFLRSFRVTFIVGVAIPISLLFAIVLIYLSGITLNIVSLGGLALGIGMLVDNSIVVMENIFRMKKEGASNKDAALQGTHQVAGAITASTLTTIGVFLPIMFIEDFIREIFYQLAMTIAFSLLASLFIALTLVPSIASKVLGDNQSNRTKEPVWDAIKALYVKVLHGFLKLRYIVLVVVLTLFVGSIMLAVSRGFEFFPASDEGSLSITVEIDPAAPISFETFAETLDQLSVDLQAIEDVDIVGISLGGGMFGVGQTNVTRANINVVLDPKREKDTMTVVDETIDLLEREYSHLIFEVSGTQTDVSMLVGSGIQIRVTGPNLDILRDEVLTLVDLLEDVEGLRDIDPGFGRESREIKVTVDKDAAIQYGLNVQVVYFMIASAIASPERIGFVNIDNHNYRVYIYEEDDQKRMEVDDITFFEDMIVGMSLTNQPVKLSDIADIDIVPGFASITRVDGARTLTLSANIDSGYNASLVAQDVEAVLADYEPPSGYVYQVLGESEEVMSTLETLILVAVLAILIVYMIMASQFQSLVYPFIIMITIPLAFTGGFLILYAFSMPVSIVAVIGLIVLSGVVVNNGIVLVDYINQLRDKGYELNHAIIEAGKIRMRPIFMTALTTILALSGLAIGFGEGAELMQPMALTAIGGLTYATFLTIFVVPIMYYVVTLKGRWIIGGVSTLIALVLSVYLWFEGSRVYSGMVLLTGIFIFSLVLFVPKKATDKTPVTTDEEDVVEAFIKGALK